MLKIQDVLDQQLLDILDIVAQDQLAQDQNLNLTAQSVTSLQRNVDDLSKYLNNLVNDTVTIDDPAAAVSVFSAKEVLARFAELSSIVGDLPKLIETVNSVKDFIAANADALNALNSNVSSVRYDVQDLTPEQRAQARKNLSVYSIEESDAKLMVTTQNLVAYYRDAKASFQAGNGAIDRLPYIGL